MDIVEQGSPQKLSEGLAGLWAVTMATVYESDEAWEPLRPQQIVFINGYAGGKRCLVTDFDAETTTIVSIKTMQRGKWQFYETDKEAEAAFEEVERDYQAHYKNAG